MNAPWPAGPRRGGGGGGGAAPAPAGVVLQPLAYDPIAAWSLAQRNGQQKDDRTGNGHSLGAVSFTYGLDVAAPQDGASAFAMNGISSSHSDGPLFTATGSLPVNDFVAAGGVSLTGWIMRMGVAQNGFDECWATGWINNPDVLFPFYYSNGSGKCLTYGNTGGVHTEFPVSLDFAKWRFFAVSMEPAGGNFVQGLDGVYQTTLSTGLSNVVGNPGQFFIGAGATEAQYGRQCAAAFSDLVLWQKPLTQAQLEAQRLGAIGG